MVAISKLYTTTCTSNGIFFVTGMLTGNVIVVLSQFKQLINAVARNLLCTAKQLSYQADLVMAYSVH